MSTSNILSSLFRKPPVLAFSDTWFRVALVFRSEISEINIVDSYAPTGEEKNSWSADEGYKGLIMCYILEENERLRLIIAGNGSGKIVAHPNSSFLFSNSSLRSFFSNVTKLTGLELLDTSGVKDMSSMFMGFSNIRELDLSSFKTGSVTTMDKMFRDCFNLKELNVDSWNTKKVESMLGMFENCYNLSELDTDSWDVKKVKVSRRMFEQCPAQTDLSFNDKPLEKTAKQSWIKRAFAK